MEVIEFQIYEDDTAMYVKLGVVGFSPFDIEKLEVGIILTSDSKLVFWIPWCLSRDLNVK